MGIEEGDKIKDLKPSPEQETGTVPPEVLAAVDQETKELGPDDPSKSSGRLRRLLIAGTIIAGVMAMTMTANPKEAKAGPNFSHEVDRAVGNTLQRASDDVGRSVGDTIGRIIGGGKTPREKEEEARLKRDIIRQQVNDAQRFNREAVKRGWQKQDNLDNTQRQLDASLIQQYRQELKDAKTPEQVKFVNDKYKSMIRLPSSSN